MAPLLWRRIPWVRVWAIGVWLVKKGRDRVEKNLSKAERQELLDLMKKSKGRQKNLTQKEQARFRSLVREAAVGAKKGR